MATKKPKASAKSTKTKTTKPKTVAKTVVKSVSEAPKTKVVEETKPAKKSCFKDFFCKKYEGNESILTIFKNSKFYGALLGEIIGTALITMIIFSLFFTGLHQMATYTAGFAIIAVYVAIYAFSGACFNPMITVGMMPSRRISVIRGIMYIIAEVIGAWIGWLVFNAFHLAGGETATDVPALAAIGENQFFIFAMVELLGAIIIAFFFARALVYKRSVFTFGAIAAGGIILATFIGVIVSAIFVNLNNNFAFNPATALMLQIFPTSGEDFGVIIAGIGQALAVYALFPMIGGVIGFYLSDLTAKLSGEE